MKLWVLGCVLLFILLFVLAILIASLTEVVKVDGGSKKKSSKVPDVELYHSTLGNEKNIIKILRDGYLRPGKYLYPDPNDPYNTNYVHLMINNPAHPTNFTGFVLDPELLLGRPYYYNDNWIGRITDGTKKCDGYASLTEIRKTLLQLHKRAARSKNHPLVNHEIFVTRHVSLHKFLRRIVVNDPDEYPNLVDYVAKEYPGVSIEKRRE